MNWFTLLCRNLYYYRCQAIALWLGAMLVSLVISSALFLGDSVSWSLQQEAARRLQGVEAVARWHGVRQAEGGILQAKGFLLDDQGNSRPVEIYGLEEKQFPGFERDAFANQALIEFLQKEKGEDFVVRLAQIPEIPLESLPGRPPRIRQVHLKLQGLLPHSMRDFSLQDSQISPLNLFVSRGFLSEQCGVDDGANLVLSPESPEVLRQRLQDSLSLDDLGLSFSQMGDFLILKSRAYFLPDFLRDGLPDGLPVLSWFAEGLSGDGVRLQYFFVAGVPPGVLDIPEDACLLSTAAVPKAVEGTFRFRYYQVGRFREIQVREHEFPLAVQADERWVSSALSAEIPGLTDSGSCSSWEAALPIDLQRIRPQDEQYWYRHGAKPQLLLNLKTAQQLFATDKVTGLIFKQTEGLEELQQRVTGLIRKQTGLIDCFSPREQAFRNAASGVNFPGLFLGLSSLVMVAALLVLLILLELHLLERRPELQLYDELGCPRSWQYRHMLLELGCILADGSLAGVLAGFGAARLLLYALLCVWGQLNGLAQLQFKAQWSSAILAFASVFLLSMAGAFYFLCRNRKAPLWQHRWKKPLRSLGDLAWRNALRHLARSRLLMLLLIIGLLLTLGIGGNAIRTAGEAGFGYQYVVSTSLPYAEDLQQQTGADLLPVRRFDASHADCTNLNRVTTPNVFGVDLQKLGLPENFLSAEGAAVDKGVLQWILKMKLGDRLQYPDGKVTLEKTFAGSIFQGGIVTSLETFEDLFPQEAGARLWLLRDGVKLGAVTRLLADYGAVVESSRERMARFDAVQNRYLMLFLGLGILALVLGLGAWALALRRTLVERQSELELLSNIGFADKQITAVLLTEQLCLLGGSLLITCLLLLGLAQISDLSLKLVCLFLLVFMPISVCSLKVAIKIHFFNNEKTRKDTKITKGEI